MATYKVKATYSVDVEIEIDAVSEDEAISKLVQKDFKEVVEDGTIWRADSENETAKVVYADYKVRVVGVDYSISEEDVFESVYRANPDVEEDSEEFYNLIHAEIDRIRADLPKDLDLELTCSSPDDLDDCISDAISEETGWLINGFDSYKILEIK